MEMTIKEMQEYLMDELATEYKNMMDGKENHYSYLAMIINDMGIMKEVK